MPRKTSKHDILKNQIRENPGLIRLEGVIRSEEEIPCYDSDGQMVCCPDLKFELNNQDYVIVEVKSSDYPRALDKLEKQLEKNHKYFRTYHNQAVKCIGVYQNKHGKLIWYEYAV